MASFLSASGLVLAESPQAAAALAPAAGARRARPQAVARPVREPQYKLGRSELTTLLSSLATMVDAGVPLYRGLHNLARNAESHQAALLCNALMQDLEAGRKLSRALSRHPKTFSPLHVGLIKVGENTGSLDQILKHIVSFEEKAQATILKIKSALTYPLIILVIAVLGLSLAPAFLLEGHFQLIRDLNVQAPLITRLLMAFSALSLSPWPYLTLIVLVLLGGPPLRKYLNKTENRIRLTEQALKVPKLGAMLRSLLVSRFARALGVQLQAGVPILDALYLAGRSTGNPLMERVADQLVARVLRGRTLSVALRTTGFFTPMFTSVVRCGEETGEVAQLVNWLADLGETELDHAIEGLVAMIEPLVMAGIGLIVGVMVLATMLPLSKALEAL